MFGEAAVQLSGNGLKLILSPHPHILHPALLAGNKNHMCISCGEEKNTRFIIKKLIFYKTENILAPGIKKSNQSVFVRGAWGLQQIAVCLFCSRHSLSQCVGGATTAGLGGWLPPPHRCCCPPPAPWGCPPPAAGWCSWWSPGSRWAPPPRWTGWSLAGWSTEGSPAGG